MPKKTLVVSCALALLSLAAPALAGPPFLCPVFDIGSTAALPWGNGGWLGARVGQAGAAPRGHRGWAGHPRRLRLPPRGRRLPGAPDNRHAAARADGDAAPRG